MDLPEYIVVGSGCSGAMAAQTLAEAGVRVLMLDGGQRDLHYAPMMPTEDFVTVRTTDPDQHRYLLGDAFEAIPFGDVGTGAQLTPPRQFIVQKVAEFLPVRSTTFFPLESLALGGLGSGWGLGCCVFSDRELQLAGLAEPAMKAAYALVADRIGISGGDGDVRPYTTAHLTGIQPAQEPDPTVSLLLNRYQRRREGLRRIGFHIGRPALALLTEPRAGREATSGRDSDFYSDAERAAYRPWITIERLERLGNFTYRGGLLVLRFKEDDEGVVVDALDLEHRQMRVFRAKRLILAPGVLGTARIVLRSLGADQALPLLCNPYYYVPCIMPARLGGAVPRRGTGFAQAAIFHDPGGTHDDVAMASIYSYRQLMLFRLMRETPLNFKDARVLLRYLLPALLIMGIHHPDSSALGKELALEPDHASPTGDRLSADCRLNEATVRRIADRERAFSRTMRRLGAWPVRQVDPGYGASIHYAGTLPFDAGGRPFTLDPSGRLNGTARVFVADGSGFRYLPAKNLTLSLMANAHLVVSRALAE